MNILFHHSIKNHTFTNSPSLDDAAVKKIAKLLELVLGSISSRKNSFLFNEKYFSECMIFEHFEHDIFRSLKLEHKPFFRGLFMAISEALKKDWEDIKDEYFGLFIQRYFTKVDIDPTFEEEWEKNKKEIFAFFEHKGTTDEKLEMWAFLLVAKGKGNVFCFEKIIHSNRKLEIILKDGNVIKYGHEVY